MLLRNYYSTLTASTIGNRNVTEDVAQELSPRYSRLVNGSYAIKDFRPEFFKFGSFGFTYGNMIFDGDTPVIGFGNNTANPTFNDYTPTGNVKTTLNGVRADFKTIYDDATKTYIFTGNYTLTNPTDNVLEINEIMLGYGNIECYYTRDTLGDNSFTIGAKESVKFEITIKYTIAEPLQ